LPPIGPATPSHRRHVPPAPVAAGGASISPTPECRTPRDGRAGNSNPAVVFPHRPVSRRAAGSSVGGQRGVTALRAGPHPATVSIDPVPPRHRARNRAAPNCKTVTAPSRHAKNPFRGLLRSRRPGGARLPVRWCLGGISAAKPKQRLVLPTEWALNRTATGVIRPTSGRLLSTCCAKALAHHNQCCRSVPPHWCAFFAHSPSVPERVRYWFEPLGAKPRDLPRWCNAHGRVAFARESRPLDKKHRPRATRARVNADQAIGAKPAACA